MHGNSNPSPEKYNAWKEEPGKALRGGVIYIIICVCLRRNKEW